MGGFFHWTQKSGEISILIVSGSSCSPAALALSWSLSFCTQLSFGCAALSSFFPSSRLKQSLHLCVSLSCCHLFVYFLFLLNFLVSDFLLLSFFRREDVNFQLVCHRAQQWSLLLCHHWLTECLVGEHCTDRIWTWLFSCRSTSLAILRLSPSQITWATAAWSFHSNCVTMECRHGAETGQKTNSVLSLERRLWGGTSVDETNFTSLWITSGLCQLVAWKD